MIMQHSHMILRLFIFSFKIMSQLYITTEYICMFYSVLFCIYSHLSMTRVIQSAYFNYIVAVFGLDIHALKRL